MHAREAASLRRLIAREVCLLTMSRSCGVGLFLVRPWVMGREVASRSGAPA